MIYRSIIKPKYELLTIENSSHNFPLHFHKRLCVGKVLAGRKYINMSGHEKRISKNEIFIIPPYTAHSCKADGNVSYMIFCCSEIDNLEMLSCGADYLKIDLRAMINLIDNACNNIFFKSSVTRYLIKYLEENYSGNIKIDELAKRLGYSKYYILHLFKKEVGISLRQYVIQLKIKAAKRKNRADNLSNTALENGFFDQSHFIKQFKKYEGVTPKEYYKSIQ
jgi:AraC-like DNA-binding protein